jgi:hypothetical protein
VYASLVSENVAIKLNWIGTQRMWPWQHTMRSSENSKLDSTENTFNKSSRSRLIKSFRVTIRNTPQNAASMLRWAVLGNARKIITLCAVVCFDRRHKKSVFMKVSAQCFATFAPTDWRLNLMPFVFLFSFASQPYEDLNSFLVRFCLCCLLCLLCTAQKSPQIIVSHARLNCSALDDSFRES